MTRYKKIITPFKPEGIRPSIGFQLNVTNTTIPVYSRDLDMTLRRLTVLTMKCIHASQVQAIMPTPDRPVSFLFRVYIAEWILESVKKGVPAANIPSFALYNSSTHAVLFFIPASVEQELLSLANLGITEIIPSGIIFSHRNEKKFYDTDRKMARSFIGRIMTSLHELSLSRWCKEQFSELDVLECLTTLYGHNSIANGAI